MKIRSATADDATTLTLLARAAKKSWGYADTQMQAWQSVLTIDEDALSSMRVWVGEDEGGVVGFYALAGEGRSVQLDHLWVRPGQMGKGVGRTLLTHALAEARAAGAEAVVIESEPNAEPFYIRMGAVRVGEVAAPIEGAPDRVLPILEIDVVQNRPSIGSEPAD
jgi:predicted N-acetyltransferase YhbS